MKRSLTGFGAVAALLLVGGAAPAGGAAEPDMVVVSRAEQQRRGTLHFTIKGRSLSGLYPGAVKQVRVTVVNPYDFRLVVRSLGGRVTATSRRRCPASPASLQVRDYRGALPVTLPPRSRTALPEAITVSMPRDVTVHCADTRFTVVLHGTGTRARR